jgi:hypothetical protein
VTTAFWIDYRYDREYASDGKSRYGAYVRQSSSIAECCHGTWDNPRVRQVRFAAAAWETATTPVMSPGYVRRHPQLISAQVALNTWDGTLSGLVEMVTPWPHHLIRSSDWQRGTAWRDWPAESRGGRTVYRVPDDDEVAAHHYLMASARLVFPLQAGAELPPAPSRRRDCEDRAREAVEALVIEMNTVVAPVITTLERS